MYGICLRENMDDSYSDEVYLINKEFDINIDPWKSKNWEENSSSIDNNEVPIINTAPALFDTKEALEVIKKLEEKHPQYKGHFLLTHIKEYHFYGIQDYESPEIVKLI